MSSNIDWNDTIKKEAEGINGEDFGEVQDVSNGFVLVQRGIIDKDRFLIPQELAESYDGDTVRFQVSEDDLLSKYREEAEEGFTNNQDNATQNVAQVEEESNTTIPLTEEKLEISKNVQEHQATITKEPITETKTVEVPVTHEEISVERRPVADGQTGPASQGPATSAEDINIPLKSEEVEYSKTPYVKEEVTVKKKPVTETKEVTEELISERVNTSEL